MGIFWFVLNACFDFWVYYVVRWEISGCTPTTKQKHAKQMHIYVKSICAQMHIYVKRICSSASLVFALLWV
jgi:hypothetical protein